MDIGSSRRTEEHALQEELAKMAAERDYYRLIAEQSGRTGLRSVHQLSRIIEHLHHTEKALRDAQHTLEIKVAQRTAALARANDELRKEIAERTKAEHDLLKSRERYRELVDGANSVILRWDRQGTILFMNPHGLNLFGFTEKELIGKNVVGTIMSPLSQNNADTEARIDAFFANPENFANNENTCKDGRKVWINWTNKAIFNEEGEHVETLSVGNDVTQRRIIGQQLKESEERLRLALAAANQGLYDLNLRTGVAKTNPEYALMLGHDPSTFEETNQKWIERLHPDDRERVTGVYRRYLNGEIPDYRVEFRQKTRAGNWKWIFSLGKIVEYDTDGRPLRMLGTHTDISDRKKSEEERLDMERRLLQSQKLESLGVLAGGIAHEFNNLLLSILGNLDLALMEVSPISPVREYLDRAIQAAQSSADLTAQMLAYSGKSTFLIQNINLSELAEEIAPLLRGSLTKPATLAMNLQRDIPDIEADVGQIQQIIMKLITNASEAIGDQVGVITLSTGVQECTEAYLQKSRLDEKLLPGLFVYLEVSDTGSGMDANTQQHMFDPFFTTKAVGRGLSMPAISGIVRGHKGGILVDSVKGQGTSIRLLFPISTSASESAPRKAASGEMREESCPMPNHGTVLIVDDEEMIRKVCRAMVEHLGFSVLTAEDGIKAVEIFQARSSEISCVLLDLSMPKKDGLATYEDIIRIKPDAKVILSTGFHEVEASSRFSAKGLAGFIQKPYRLATLRSTLHNIMF
jgi:PAS domain S-box-containing protein